MIPREQEPFALRVLHGLGGSAGQPSTLARALRRVGVDARSVQFGRSKFQYPTDIVVDLDGDRRDIYLDAFRSLVDDFDLFHLHARAFLHTDHTNLSFPHAWDLVLLRLLGKRVVFHFRGSEVRLHSEFKRLNRFNYVDENPDQLVSKFPEESMIRSRDFVCGLASRVFVTDPELASYVPGSKVIPRALDFDSWPHVGPRNRDNPLIIHAPSRRVVKGTQSILDAIDRLRDRGLKFRFKLVEGLTNQQARKIYEDADIVVDQLRIGWYGVLATEAMALGKATVSYIREDLVGHLPDPAPIAIANPDTIVDVLARLVEDPERREALGRRGRAHAVETHDSERVAELLVAEYRAVDESPGEVDLEAITEMIRHQSRLQDKAARPAASAPTLRSTPYARFRNAVRERGWRQAVSSIPSAMRRELRRYR